nr:DMT family transporter [uncultured Prevotella sp.]
MNTSSSIKGYGYASLSAITFGTIPLFSIPVMKAGMLLPSVLIYRFAFGCFFMMVVLLWRKQNLHIKWGDGLRIMFLSIMYAVSAVCLFSSYEYMPGGIATTLLFSYPVWTEILLIIFFNEKLSIRISLVIILAIAGVAFLGGIGQTDGIKSLWGVTLAMSSGLLYAIYMVIFPHMRISKLPALKVNFYIFFMAMLLLILYSSFTTGGIQHIPDADSFLSLVLLGLIPTTISNVTLVRSLTLIDSASVAILGAFEPLTAMTIGVTLMGEPLTTSAIIGCILIITSVILLITKGKTLSNPLRKNANN